MYLGSLSLERAATVRVIGFSKPKPGLGIYLFYEWTSLPRLSSLNSRSGGLCKAGMFGLQRLCYLGGVSGSPWRMMNEYAPGWIACSQIVHPTPTWR